MKIKITCEHCGKVYQTDDSYLGQTAQCRNCQKYFTMTLFEDQPGESPLAAPGQAQPPGQEQTQPGRPRPQETAPAEHASSKVPTLLLLLIILLAVGALVTGPEFFPEFFRDLGLPNLLDLLLKP